MSIAQRGTSVTGVNTNNGFPTLDRFKIGFTSSGTYDMSQSTDVPSGKGFSSSLKIKCASTDTSIASGDEFMIQHRIEAQNLQYLKYGTSNAENLTLSFYAKAVNKTGTYCVHLQKNDSTSAYFYSEFSVTTSWQKFSISIPANSVVQSSGGAISNDSGIGIIVMFFLMNGSSTQGTDAKDQWSTTNHRTSSNQVNFLDSTSNEFYITGVQLETGSQASDFEFLPTDVNTSRCQRYFNRPINGNSQGICTAGAYNSSDAFGIYIFPIKMRTTPSIETTNGSSYYKFIGNNTGTSFDGPLVLSTGTESSAQLAFSSFGGALTQGVAGAFRTNNASSSVAFSAEL
tara:strand:- start:171 stop:1199 length:1029 start_codon:yes stop_codon:yes gene_type:complete